jgi:hypothetical protein
MNHRYHSFIHKHYTACRVAPPGLGGRPASVHSRNIVYYRPINQLYIGHWCLVTCPIAALEDSNIPSRSYPVTRTKFRKQLRYTPLIS